jgi:hypothetical protein
VSFSPNLLPKGHSVTCECATLSVRETLDRLLEGTRLQYEIAGQVLLVDVPARQATIRLAGAQGGGESAATTDPIATGEAYALVNQVRARAGLQPLAAGMGYAQFRRALYWERQWELSMEQQALFDGRRFWDLYTEQVIEQSRLGQTQPAKYPRLTVPQILVSISDRDRLHPIPQNALDRNGELVQNPGW